MGYIDDRYNLNAYLKLSISVIIYIFILSFSETLILKNIYIESLNISYTFDKIGKFFTILCLLLLINSLNLVDGINGLASCFVTLWMLCLALLSNGNTQILLFIFSILILINTYHIIKGKYFLGDSGSLFFGSLVGLLTIYTYNNLLLLNFSISVEKIFIFFMIPGIDMFRLFLFRIMIKKDPFSKDLNHMHHLILKYFSLKTTLAIYFILFFITNFLSFFNFLKPIIIIFIYLIIYVFFIFYTKEKFEKSPK
jgi:UDP-GlcNAc:undecaprenyl-phosphate GlcNAc-1-phosphate transferase|tara:strand:- start:2574 stop:3332 length:759 start_codon:yes stop_codon:yes gene_type:complete